jgi:hypothetical protein
MIDTWLSLPLPALILSLVCFYGASGLLLTYLSFGRATGHWVQSFRGIVAPYFNGIVVIFAILVGFLANDVWDRNRRAAASVRSEAGSLVSLHDLVAASGLPKLDIDRGIRAYVSAVAEKEWPSMVQGEAAPDAEIAQDNLLESVANLEAEPSSSAAFERVMLDTAMKIREARAERLALSSDYSENFKWAGVLLLALIAQVSIAAVHLEKPRPQIAALFIFTSGVVVLLGLIAAHELPFGPPLSISPEPLVKLLRIIKD